MAYPLKRFSDQLEGASTNKVGIQDVSASPLKLDEKGAEEDEDDARPMTSFMPQVMKSKLWHELTSVRTWRNHVIWRAGVSLTSRSLEVKHEHISPDRRARYQVIEGVGSGSLNFVSGLVVATLSNWPRAAVPAGNFIYITILVSCLISATMPATGGHINPLITMATAFSGLCHPVRAIIYLFCQLVGGAIGGALLRVALGKKLAYHIHNGGCWIDPGGEVDVWQAASIEFTCSFILMFVELPSRSTLIPINHYPRFLAFGVGLDPRQAKVFGAKYGPILVGLIVGLM